MKAGWSIERLGHAAKFVDYRGKTPPKTAEGIRLITAKNVKMGFVQRHPIEYIDPAAYNGWMTRGFPEYGDVLFTTEAPLGNVAQLDTREKVVIGQRLITLKTDVNRTDPTFLKYALLSPQVQAEIHSRATGATVQGIKASLLKQVPIPLPPLEEQQRIVAVLDEAFEGLARARAHAEANLKNAWELFDAALRTYFTDGASGWSTAHLKDVCLDFGRGKSKHRPRNDASLYGGEVPFVQTGDISKADHFIKEYSQTYSKRGLAQSKLWPRGTVCVAIVGATIGESGILDFDACFPDSVIGMTPHPKKGDAEYIEYLLQFFKAELKEAGKGSARDNINLATFCDKRFPMPDVEIQREVAAKLNELSAETQQLAAHYASKLINLKKLRQSLLAKAFAGELT